MVMSCHAMVDIDIDFTKSAIETHVYLNSTMELFIFHNLEQKYSVIRSLDRRLFI